MVSYVDWLDLEEVHGHFHPATCWCSATNTSPDTPVLSAAEGTAERFPRRVPKQSAERLLVTRGQVQRELRIVTIHLWRQGLRGRSRRKRVRSPLGQWRWQDVNTNDPG